MGSESSSSDFLSSQVDQEICGDGLTGEDLLIKD
jgi:hypothetical protein